MKPDRSRFRALAEILTSTTRLMPIADQIECAPDLGLLAVLCQRLSLVKPTEGNAVEGLVALDARVTSLAVQVHDCAARTRPTRFRRLREEVAAEDSALDNLVALLAEASGNPVSRAALVDEARAEMISRALVEIERWRATQAATPAGEILPAAQLPPKSHNVVKIASASEHVVDLPVEPAPDLRAVSERSVAIGEFVDPVAEAENCQKRAAGWWLVGEIASILCLVSVSVWIDPAASREYLPTYLSVHTPIWLGLASLVALCHRLSAQHRQKENEYRTDRLATVTNPKVRYYLESLPPTEQAEIIVMIVKDWLDERRGFRKSMRKDRAATDSLIAALTSALGERDRSVRDD